MGTLPAYSDITEGNVHPHCFYPVFVFLGLFFFSLHLEYLPPSDYLPPFLFPKRSFVFVGDGSLLNARHCSQAMENTHLISAANFSGAYGQESRGIEKLNNLVNGSQVVRSRRGSKPRLVVSEGTELSTLVHSYSHRTWMGSPLTEVL